jgi:hypothetical protein
VWLLSEIPFWLGWTAIVFWWEKHWRRYLSHLNSALSAETLSITHRFLNRALFSPLYHNGNYMYHMLLH